LECQRLPVARCDACINRGSATASRGKLDGKAAPAAAARLRIRVRHAEGRASQILDEIDGRAFDEVEADRVDNKLDAVGFDDLVIVLGRVGKLKLVREAG